VGHCLRIGLLVLAVVGVGGAPRQRGHRRFERSLGQKNADHHVRSGRTLRCLVGGHRHPLRRPCRCPRSLPSSRRPRVAAGIPQASSRCQATGNLLLWKHITLGDRQYHSLLALPYDGAGSLVLDRQWPRPTPRRVRAGWSRLRPRLRVVDRWTCRSEGVRRDWQPYRLPKRRQGRWLLSRSGVRRPRRVKKVPPTRLAVAGGRTSRVGGGRQNRPSARDKDERPSPFFDTSNFISVSVSHPAGTHPAPLAFDGKTRRRPRGTTASLFGLTASRAQCSSVTDYRLGRPTSSCRRMRSCFRVGPLDRGFLDGARVARAAAGPIGLSIEGRRIAWAENLHRRGRVRGPDAA